MLIPKAAGGTRPRDQQPITILPLLYRLWSKGVSMEWSAVLHGAYLGQAAFGFRAQTGTLHMAQLLSDIIVMRRRQREELWLASFDVEKCYDSIPWWALFGGMRRAGVAESVVRTFEAFYQGLRRHFRYGQFEGSSWRAANSLMQGCPAAPDQLNMLLEPFHQWALAHGHGVEVGAKKVASVLVARDKGEMAVLVEAYLRWCELLDLKVTMVQLWSNKGEGQELEVGALKMRSSSQFRIVGVVLGENEKQLAEAHF